jgi:hypothetical protein
MAMEDLLILYSPVDDVLPCGCVRLMLPLTVHNLLVWPRLRIEPPPIGIASTCRAASLSAAAMQRGP